MTTTICTYCHSLYPTLQSDRAGDEHNFYSVAASQSACITPGFVLCTPAPGSRLPAPGGCPRHNRHRFTQSTWLVESATKA
jgi:hypothetical protein